MQQLHSIGIELEGLEGQTFEPEQYESFEQSLLKFDGALPHPTPGRT
jgi:N-acetyl-anhydromuramyl-L-alanine amidase AmpD